LQPLPGPDCLGTAFSLPVAGRIDVGVHGANATLSGAAPYLSPLWQVRPIAHLLQSSVRRAGSSRPSRLRRSLSNAAISHVAGGPPHKTSGIDSVCEQCHLPCMRGNTTPAGWVVQLTIPVHITPKRLDGTPWIGPASLGAPSLQYFDVATADVAVKETRKHLGCVRALSAAEVASIPLSLGEVRRA
jgi:hypothetical protein